MTTKAKLLIVVTILVALGVGFFAGYEVERERVVNALTSGLTHASKELQKETSANPGPETWRLEHQGKENTWTQAEVAELQKKVESEKTPVLTVRQASCSVEQIIAKYTPTELTQGRILLPVLDEIKTTCGIALE
jgi:hypothetical protein